MIEDNTCGNKSIFPPTENNLEDGVFKRRVSACFADNTDNGDIDVYFVNVSGNGFQYACK